MPTFMYIATFRCRNSLGEIRSLTPIILISSDPNSEFVAPAKVYHLMQQPTYQEAMTRGNTLILQEFYGKNFTKEQPERFSEKSNMAMREQLLHLVNRSKKPLT